MIPHNPRAPVDARAPEAKGFCDRCNFVYRLCDLNWQFDYRGNHLTNLRILVCDICLDKPFEHYRPFVLPPDPVPIKDPRPGFQATQEGSAPPVQSVAQLVDSDVI